jgi:hypothetical protein
MGFLASARMCDERTGCIPQRQVPAAGWLWPNTRADAKSASDRA